MNVLDVLNALMPSTKTGGDDANSTAPAKPKTLADYQRLFGANSAPVQQTYIPPPPPDNSAAYAAASADATARLHTALQTLGTFATRLRIRQPFANSGSTDPGSGDLT